MKSLLTLLFHVKILSAFPLSSKGMFLNIPFEDAPLMWWTINQIIQKYKLKLNFVFLDNLISSPPHQWSPGTSTCLCVLK